MQIYFVAFNSAQKPTVSNSHGFLFILIVINTSILELPDTTSNTANFLPGTSRKGLCENFSGLYMQRWDCWVNEMGRFNFTASGRVVGPVYFPISSTGGFLVFFTFSLWFDLTHLYFSPLVGWMPSHCFHLYFFNDEFVHRFIFSLVIWIS